jgi:hypothetical protein
MNNATQTEMLADLTAASRSNDIANISRLMGILSRSGVPADVIVRAERAGVGEPYPNPEALGA